MKFKENSISLILRIKSEHRTLPCFVWLLLVSSKCVTPIWSGLYYSSKCRPELNTFGPVRMWEQICAAVNPGSNLGKDIGNTNWFIPRFSQFLRANDSLSPELGRTSRLQILFSPSYTKTSILNVTCSGKLSAN